jgi:hypothetical protein
MYSKLAQTEEEARTSSGLDTWLKCLNHVSKPWTISPQPLDPKQRVRKLRVRKKKPERAQEREASATKVCILMCC